MYLVLLRRGVCLRGTLAVPGTPLMVTAGARWRPVWRHGAARCLAMHRQPHDRVPCPVPAAELSSGKGEELARHCSLPIPNHGAQRCFTPGQTAREGMVCPPHTRREKQTLQKRAEAGWAGSVTERGP